jgi:hypothetical protein
MTGLSNLWDAKPSLHDNIILTAKPENNYLLSKWIIDGTEYDGQDTIGEISRTIDLLSITDEVLVVSATFKEAPPCELGIQYILTVAVSPEGSGTVSEGTREYCEKHYAQVLATNIPGLGYRFDHWSLGSDEIKENPITIYMDTNKSLTAHFVIDTSIILDGISYEAPTGALFYCPSETYKDNTVAFDFTNTEGQNNFHFTVDFYTDEEREKLVYSASSFVENKRWFYNSTYFEKIPTSGVSVGTNETVSIVYDPEFLPQDMSDTQKSHAIDNSVTYEKPLICGVKYYVELGVHGESADMSSESFRFTAIGDIRTGAARTGPAYLQYQKTLQAMNSLFGWHGQGAFQMTVGDIDAVAENRDKVDSEMGMSALWIPVVGNHELAGQWNTYCDGIECIEWIRNEFGGTGNEPSNQRKGIQLSLNAQAGPPGCSTTQYYFDYENIRFIIMNWYWDGTDTPNADQGNYASGYTNGKVIPQQLVWLETQLADAESKRLGVIVVGHEPAFNNNKKKTDCLDRDGSLRNEFWELLEDYNVMMYMCGDSHVFSAYMVGPEVVNGVGEWSHEEKWDRKNNVFALDMGLSAAYSTYAGADFEVFADITVDRTTMKIDIYKADTSVSEDPSPTSDFSLWRSYVLDNPYSEWGIPQPVRSLTLDCKKIDPYYWDYNKDANKWLCSGQGKMDLKVADGFSQSLNPSIDSNLSGIHQIVWQGRRSYGQNIYGAKWDSTQDLLYSSGQGLSNTLELAKPDQSTLNKPIVLSNALNNFYITSNDNDSILHRSCLIKSCSVSDLEVGESFIEPAVRRVCYPGELKMLDNSYDSIKMMVLKEDIAGSLVVNSNKTVPVIDKTSIRIDIDGIVGAYAVRLKDMGEEDWSAWIDIDNEPGDTGTVAYRIDNSRFIVPWNMIRYNGMKRICCQVLTMYGISSTFCLELLANFDAIQHVFEFYTDASMSNPFPTYNGQYVLSVNYGSNNATNDKRTVYFKVIFNEEVTNAGLNFRVAQQGSNDTHNKTLISVGTDNKVFKGDFDIYTDDGVFNKDGSAFIELIFPDDSSGCKFDDADKYNLFNRELDKKTSIDLIAEEAYSRYTSDKLSKGLDLNQLKQYYNKDDVNFKFGNPGYFRG